MTEFAAALGGPGYETSVPTRGVFAGRRGRRAALVLGVAVVLLGGGAAVRVWRHRGPALNERRVVVAVIENHTGDPSLDNVGHMAADWVTQGLAQTGLVEVVPSVSVMSSSRTPGGHGPGHLDAVGIQTLGRETGAGTVVSGAYYRQADSIRFQVQISAAHDGTVLRALEPVAGPIAQPLVAVEAVRQRVMATLATLFDSRLSFWAKSAGQPPTFPAYQEFIQGLDRMVQFDSRGAIGHFRRAAREDTTFRLPLIFAAHEHMDLGEFATADSIAHAVERAPGRLSPLDQHYLTWVLAQSRGDRAQSAARNDRRPERARARSRPVSGLVGLLVLSDLRLPPGGGSWPRAEGGARRAAAPPRRLCGARSRSPGARRPGPGGRHHRATGRGAEPPATARVVPRRHRPDRGARAGGARSPGGGAGGGRVGGAVAGKPAAGGGALRGQPVSSRPRLLCGRTARRHPAPARGSRVGGGARRPRLLHHAVDRHHHG
ncbi:MAG: hypothetical protein DMD57_13935 [Gemmatimonadetes bacterium]|nr:MAG: hypothetical protein DMD57_13935 [Gemmatimonadota bacterium]